jgi:hypothetical protein
MSIRHAKYGGRPYQTLIIRVLYKIRNNCTIAKNVVLEGIKDVLVKIFNG